MEKSCFPSGRRVGDRMVRVNAPLCTLGEGPLWHRETQEFVFTDIVNGLLYAWNPKTNESRTVLSCRFQLGAFLFDTLGNLILFTESGVYTCPYESASEDRFTLLFPVKMMPGERFNDAICDPRGRMIAGTKTENNENGTLYLFETGKPPRVLMSGLQISNGMGFSGDQTTFYHTDSGRRTIYRYRYDPETGSIFHPCSPEKQMIPGGGPFGDPLWTALGNDGAVPDGMTVDEAEQIWTALWDRGCVICIDPESRNVTCTLPLPARQVSSVAFGGTALRQLLVTSASIQSPDAHNGEIYCLTPGPSGREEYRYRSK